MAINFPNAPSEQQTYISGKTLYTFTNGAWRPTPVPTALPFNFIVNSDYLVSQQNGTNAASLNGYYAADQWCGYGGGYVPNTQKVTSGNTTIPYFINLQNTTTKATAAGDYIFLNQSIEGTRTASLLWGTPAAKPIVIRVMAASNPSGNYAISLRNAAATRSYIIPMNGVNAGTKTFTYAVPGDTTGGTTAWPINTGDGLTISVVTCTGSTYQTATPNTWLAGNYLGTSTQSQMVTSGNNMIIGGVGIYADPNSTGLAPPMDHPPESSVLFDCQRYWQKCVGAIGIGIPATTTHQRASYMNIVPMRTTPTTALVGTMRAYDVATAPTITAIATSYTNTAVSEFNFTANAAQTAGRAAMLIDTNGTTIYIATSAR